MSLLEFPRELLDEWLAKVKQLTKYLVNNKRNYDDEGTGNREQ